mmetsp:Transcript_72259/g.203893  ORF Transcript_72259/g.203893 Transcript_72259/m.203893 type:complete len:124 (+) Transcript_72259:431-802(+)
MVKKLHMSCGSGFGDETMWNQSIMSCSEWAWIGPAPAVMDGGLINFLCHGRASCQQAARFSSSEGARATGIAVRCISVRTGTRADCAWAGGVVHEYEVADPHLTNDIDEINDREAKTSRWIDR